MEDSIKVILEAEEDAAEQAAQEAEKANAEFRQQLEKQFQEEFEKKGGGDDDVIRQMELAAKGEMDSVDVSYEKNKDAVIQLLLHSVTTVKLEVSEAMKQSLIAPVKEV